MFSRCFLFIVLVQHETPDGLKSLSAFVLAFSAATVLEGIVLSHTIY